MAVAEGNPWCWGRGSVGIAVAGLSTLACAALAFYVTFAFLEARELKRNESVFVEFFTARMDGTRLLGKGWLTPEPFGTWSEGPRAEVGWPLESLPATDISVTLNADVFPADAAFRQTIEVIVNDTQVATVTSNIDGGILGGSFTIPRRVAEKRNPMLFVFDVQRPTSPKQHGIGADERLIGIRLKNIALRYSPSRS